MINLDKLTDAKYQSLKVEIVGIAEGFGATPYADSKGIPTIGVGFNLRIYADLVGKQVFGLNYSPALIDKLMPVFNKSYTVGTQAQRDDAIKSAVKVVLDQWNLDHPANKVGDKFSLGKDKDDPVAHTRATNILTQIDDTYENAINTKFTNFPSTPPGFSDERAVLFSLAYNNPSLIGVNLINAFDNDFRGEIWYQIRYQSNKEHDNGIANRRYVEAHYFELFDNPANPNQADAEQAAKMYGARRDSIILDYERNYSPDTADAKKFNNTDKVVDIYKEMTPAIETLKALYPIASGAEIEEVMMASVGKPDLNGDHRANDVVGSVTKDADKIFDNANNDQDLLIGDGAANTLDGMKGSDVLIGALGNDTLIGSAGSDRMHGGSTSGLAIDKSDGIDTADYRNLPDSVKILCTYNDDKWVVTKTDSAGVYNGTDTLQSVEHIFGNGHMIFDIQRSATPKPGMVFSDVILDGTYEIEFRYTDKGNSDDVIRPSAQGIFISGYGDIHLTHGSDARYNISGGGGHDVINMNSPYYSVYASSTLNGGAGDDIISGSSNNDVLDGGAGNDYIIDGTGNDTIRADKGDIIGGSYDYEDRLYVNGTLITDVTEDITGALKDNAGNIWDNRGLTIIGNQVLLNELFSEGTFGIKIHYLSHFVGNLYYANGNDTLTGGAGNDTFQIRGEKSVMNGGDGNDAFSYDYQSTGDVVDGGNGIDRLIINGNKKINIDLSRGSFSFEGYGAPIMGIFKNIEKIEVAAVSEAQVRSDGNINDNLAIYSTSSVNASLGQGNDYFSAGNLFKASSIYGGAGYDVLGVTGATNVFMDGGQGDDWLRYWYNSSSVIAGTPASTIIGGMGQDHIDVQRPGISALVMGDEGNDTITVWDDMTNTVHGGVGDDSIICGNGNDVIIWVEGADTIDGGAGNDSVNAWLSVSQAAEAAHTTGGVAAWLAAHGVTILNAEHVVSVTKNILIGGDNADNLAGGSGADTIWGMDGADTLTGGAGDTLVGGMGNDVFIIAGTPVTVLDDDGAIGDRIVFGTAVTSVTGAIIGQNLVLTANNGTKVTIVGQVQNDDPAIGTAVLGNGTVVDLDKIALTQNGTTGADRIDGITGHGDIINAGAGADTIYGYDGADTLYGGDGVDWFYGGVGNDILYGGAGADHFTLIGSSQGSDIIYDFNLAQGDRVTLATGSTYTKTDLGADIRIAANGNTITLIGVADFDVGMIEFAA